MPPTSGLPDCHTTAGRSSSIILHCMSVSSAPRVDFGRLHPPIHSVILSPFWQNLFFFLLEETPYMFTNLANHSNTSR